MSIFDWFQTTYSKEEVQKLIEQIKAYNAGVIDDHLNRYIDEVFTKWIEETK